MIDPNLVFRMVWLLFGAIAVAIVSMFGRMAHAYIPRGRVILEKVGRQHGKGSFLVQQEVTFRDDKGPIILIEDWVIENGESLTLDARGSGQRASYIYKGKQKMSIDEKGVDRSFPVSNDFFEPIFYYRGWENLADFLLKEKIIPTKNLVRETMNKTTKEYSYVPDPFVRLSRTAGVIALAFGQPTPAESGKALPGLWVEQDRFLIRRLRLESQADISADDYSEFSSGLWYPRNRTVSWGDQTAHIRTLKVSATSLPPSVKERLNPSNLRKRADAKELFTNPVVADFYKRFR